MKNFALISLSLLVGFAAQARNVKFVAQDSPPFNFAEGKDVKGASVDLQKKVCEKLKWTCTFDIVPQKRGLTMIEAGEADIIMGLIAIPEREKVLTHSTPTWSSNLAFVGMKSTKALSKPEELKGFTVVGVRASAAHKKATEVKEKGADIKVLEANSYPEAFKALFENSYGDKAAVSSYEDVGTYIAKQAKKEVHSVYVLEQVKFVSGISKKSDAKVLEEFNKAVDDLRKSGELKAVLAPWGMQQ